MRRNSASSRATTPARSTLSECFSSASPSPSGPPPTPQFPPSRPQTRCLAEPSPARCNGRDMTAGRLHGTDGPRYSPGAAETRGPARARNSTGTTPLTPLDQELAYWLAATLVKDYLEFPQPPGRPAPEPDAPLKKPLDSMPPDGHHHACPPHADGPAQPSNSSGTHGAGPDEVGEPDVERAGQPLEEREGRASVASLDPGDRVSRAHSTRAAWAAW